MQKGNIFILFFLLSNVISIAQEDSANARGTIKVGKPKVTKARVYVKADAQFGYLDNSKTNFATFNDYVFIPFPIVEGHAYPFNYTGFFNDKFKTKSMSLEGKDADTITIEVKVLANGKIYVKDKSPMLMVNGVAAFYNETVGGYEINSLHVNCMDFVKSIKEWIPAYMIVEKKAKFKKQVVIKPNKKNLDAIGIIKIYFSTSPFDY